MADDLDWDLLRTFEVVARLGSLTAASKSLGVSQSTVSRQLARLESRAGSPLLLRRGAHDVSALTDRGAAVLEAVRPMLHAGLAARAALEDAAEVHGEVTLATVGEVLRWSLVSQLPDLYARHPRLQLRVRIDNQVQSLAAGEADLAVRLVRPARGELIARRLRTATYGFFASEACALGPEVPWLGLTGSLASIPEQRLAEKVFSPRPASLLVEDVEALGLAVQAGLGVAILPHGLAARLSGLVEVPSSVLGRRVRIPPRSLYAVVHESKRRVPKVRAVLEWLVDAMG